MNSFRASSLILAAIPSLILWVITHRTVWLAWSLALLLPALLLVALQAFPNWHTRLYSALDRSVGDVGGVPPDEDHMASALSDSEDVFDGDQNDRTAQFVALGVAHGPSRPAGPPRESAGLDTELVDELQAEVKLLVAATQ